MTTVSHAVAVEKYVTWPKKLLPLPKNVMKVMIQKGDRVGRQSSWF